MKQFFIFLALCALSLVYSKQVDFSQLANPCPRNIDNYEECSRQALEQRWPRLIAGISEANLPPLDPLKIGEMNGTIKYGVVGAKYYAKNIVIYGFANSKFVSVKPKVEDDRLHVELELHMPKCSFEADYEGEGKYTNYVLRAKGHMNVSLTDVTSQIMLDGPVVDDRWVLETVKVTPEIGDMKFWASDLLWNEALTETALEFFNLHWRLFYDIGMPVWQERMNTKVKEFLSKIFTEIPFSQIFPH